MLHLRRYRINWSGLFSVPQTSIPSCVWSGRERNLLWPLLSVSNAHFCTVEYVNTSCMADVRCEVEVRVLTRCGCAVWPHPKRAQVTLFSHPREESFRQVSTRRGTWPWWTPTSLALCSEQLPPSLQLTSPSILTSTLDGGVAVPSTPRCPSSSRRAILSYSSQRRRWRTCNPTPKRKIVPECPSCNQTQAS